MRQSLWQIRRGLSRGLEWAVILAMALLTLDVLWGVFSRYALGSQSRWTDELATTLMIWVALLGGALAFGERAHLGMDFLVQRLDPAARRLAEGIVLVLVLFFAASVMVYGGCLMVARTLESEQVLPALGWKKGFVYAAVPVSGLFIIIYALELLGELLLPRHRPEENGKG